MALRKALSRLTQAGYTYTLVNTLVSVIAFGRNFLFMKTLGLADVSQIAMMQTIVMLVGFVQLGTLNGAYILFAEQKFDQTRRIVTLLSWYVIALIALAVAAAFAGAGTVFAPLIARETLLIGCFAGIATIASAWMNNLLIVKGALGRSNIINVGAVLVSLALALLSSQHGLGAALLSILAQPLMVVCGALLIDREIRPSIKASDAQTLNKVLALGFMPFLGALFTLASYQLERWTIAVVLGEQALGSFYLVMLYIAFFALIPTALLNVSFPRAMRALQGADNMEFNRIRKRHFNEILAYGAVAAVGTFTLLPLLVENAIPEYQSSVMLTFLVFPSVLIFSLSDNAALVLYSFKNTRPMLFSGLVLLTSYAALLAAAALLDSFSLTSVVILRCVAVLISSGYLFWASNTAIRGLT
jgi:O-antigen/teichoic acid export membrane protein